LLAPAGWLAAGAADADRQQAAEEAPPVWTAPAPAGNGPSLRSELVSAGYEDLVGAVVDLPSFLPGDDEVDEACPTEEAVVVPGWADTPDETGAVFLKEYATVRFTEGGEQFPLALLGCDHGDGTAFQVVALSHVDGQWSTLAQLAATRADGAVPAWAAPAIGLDPGVTIGFTERYDPGADDLDYWFESVTLDAEGEPVRTPVDGFDAEGYADLDVTMAAAATDEPGVWDLTATVRNDGPRDATGYEVYLCVRSSQSYMDIGLPDCDGGECADTGDGCPDDREPAAVVDLPVGEHATYEWTVAIDLDRWQAYLDALGDAVLVCPMFQVDVQKDTDDPAIPRAFTRATLHAEFLP
ncbi:hypothetical protein, partial [Glycomyces endophyticus]|uniref:hypothetical protein n=1 Tax=Glycomyces endophyticus TaxID=480996 RepID=UPI0031DC12A8